MRKIMMFAAAALGVSSAALAQVQTSPNGYPPPATGGSDTSMPANPPSPSNTMSTLAPATASPTPRPTARPTPPSPLDSAPDGTPVRKRRN